MLDPSLQPRDRQRTPRLPLLPCLVAASILIGSAHAAVLPVSTLADLDLADGDCSLREAIVAADTDAAYRDCPAGNGDDEIEIVVAGTITLVAALPAIATSLSLRGLGADVSTLDGASAHRLLELLGGPAGTGERLRIEGLRLTGGDAGEGGAVAVGRNRTLEVADCVFDGNHADLEGGALHGERPTAVSIARSSFLGNVSGSLGGAMVVNGGTVEIVDSTFAGNVAEGSSGGAVYLLTVGQLTVRRSTFSGNRAAADGGGLAAVVTPVRVESSTFLGNLADSDDDDTGDGGGLSAAGPIVVTLFDTVLAQNQDGTTVGISCPDGMEKLGADVVSDGVNLVGINECIAAGFPAGLPNLQGDLVGTLAAPLDPLLGALDSNGGPTATHLPLPASPAIDQGACPGAAADQRGYGDRSTLLRIVDDPLVPDVADGCDIRAVELGASDLTGLVFYDGFETGDLARWSASLP